ncbi:DUF1353 domain-containing protein [Castellaniella sp. UC4442_H9]
MARFLNKLRVEETDDAGSGRWRLLAALLYQSDIFGHLIAVPAGFVTDFGSVPRLPFAYAWFGDIAHDAATVHDWLYSVHRTSRRTADAVLREAMAATGVSWIQRWAWWLGVRLFGGSHW